MNAHQFAFKGLLLVGLAAIASASPIPVTNPSFETLPGGGLTLSCGTGCAYALGPIPGWTNSGVSGQLQPGTGGGSAFNSLPDGPTVVFDNDTNGQITQNVGTVGAAGIVYTLQVDLGVRKDTPIALGLAELLIGSTIITATGTAPTAGNWSNYTATYTTVAGDIGKTLTIELVATGVQSDFDNVRLDASAAPPVPEPMTTGLVGMGLTLLGFVARRKRS